MKNVNNGSKFNILCAMSRGGGYIFVPFLYAESDRKRRTVDQKHLKSFEM
jgi:hypothetical protein